ncbi:MAG: hypothetical protein ACR2OJ_13805 [Hyphomicrobiales bacterium]
MKFDVTLPPNHEMRRACNNLDQMIKKTRKDLEDSRIKLSQLEKDVRELERDSENPRFSEERRGHMKNDAERLKKQKPEFERKAKGLRNKLKEMENQFQLECSFV